MTEKTVVDKNGCTMKVIEYKGQYLPMVPGITDIIGSLKDMKVRDDDIIICGYPRSGTNWVWEVVTMLMTGVAENSTLAKVEYMLEYKTLKHIDQLAAPRVLNSHLFLEDLPAGFAEKRCKMLYMYRNPKDVAVSMHHFVNKDLLSDYTGTFDGMHEFLLEGKVMYGSWFKNVKEWDKVIRTRNDLRILPISFEDLKIDFSTQVKRLAQFLGVNHDDDFFAKVEQKCNLQNLKAAKEKCYDEDEKSFWREGKPAYIRKGMVGDWVNTFTVAQNEIWDQKIAEELKDVQLEFKYSMDD